MTRKRGGLRPSVYQACGGESILALQADALCVRTSPERVELSQGIVKR